MENIRAHICRASLLNPPHPLRIPFLVGTVSSLSHRHILQQSIQWLYWQVMTVGHWEAKKWQRPSDQRADNRSVLYADAGEEAARELRLFIRGVYWGETIATGKGNAEERWCRTYDGQILFPVRPRTRQELWNWWIRYFCRSPSQSASVVTGPSVSVF